VQKSGAGDDEDDAGTFLTRISQDGQGSPKQKNLHVKDDYDSKLD